MKSIKKGFFIIIITITLASCSDNVNQENKLSETNKVNSTEKNDVNSIDNIDDNSIVSGTFGSDGAFTSSIVNLEVSEEPELPNDQIYEEIYNDFLFHYIEPIGKNNLLDNNNLLEQFINKDGNKLGKFFLQKNIANYLYSYYSNSMEGKTEKDYILFNKNTFTSKEMVSIFEKEYPQYSKNNNLNNDYLENVFLLELNKNTIDDLPKYSNEVDELIKNLFIRKNNNTFFDNESLNTVNLFFIFEFIKNNKEKTVCTLILPNKISLYAMDVDYGSTYIDFYKNSSDIDVKLNLPDLSSIVGKIQAFTSFYTSCISL